jgi:2-polyprenyl-3-methyl-5-hydroxy-6-metoxy-1,4-benzoquinol methylase
MGKPTRGTGRWEDYLSRTRAGIADTYIEEIHRQGRILDIGCGENHVFLTKVRFKQKFGADQLFNGLKKKKNITLFHYDISSMKKLSYPNKYFDVVTMLAILEHLTQKEALFLVKEIRRLLKPGGRLILTTPPSWVDLLLRVMARLNLVSKEEIEEHKVAYTPRTLRRLLTKAGFKKDKIRVGFYQFILNMKCVAEK